MYNLRMWEELNLHLNVQAHLYDRDGQAISTLAHSTHFYSPTNLELTLVGQRNPHGHIVNAEYAIIICNMVVIAKLYIDPRDYIGDRGYYGIDLDIGETVAIHER